MYILHWRNQAVDIAKVPITVPVGSVVTDKASVVLTGKGAPNYGAVQQTNMLLMLENFADSAPPPHPTVGQIWYDSDRRVPKVLVDSVTNDWKSIGGVQITQNGDLPPANPGVGELWLELLPNKIDYILYIYTSTGRYPSTSGTIGGWAQLWPTPTFTGARDEYDAVLTLLNKYIGPTAAPSNGNGAIGTIIRDLTDFDGLDLSLRNKIVANGGSTGTPDGDLAIRVEPDSNDWDTLLAAAKLALNRLDVPASIVKDIARVPFVTDGRPAPAGLLALGNTDIRYPSVERRGNQIMGSITLHRMYTETLNALTVAMVYRYALRGISGQSGTYPDLDTVGTVTYTPHATYEGSVAATTANFNLRLNFASAANRDLWCMSGGAFDIGISNGTSGGTTADIDLRGLLQARGFVRVNQDKTRVFGPSRPLTLAESPAMVGFGSLNTADTIITTQQNAGGTVKYVVTMSKPNATSVQIKVTITTSTAMSNALSFKTARIVDTMSSFSGGQAFGPGPTAFAPADAAGSSAALVQKSAVLP